MSRIPVRMRLVGWFVMVLAVILLALGSFIVTRLRAELTAERDRALQRAAQQIAQAYRAEGPTEFREAAQDLLPGQRTGESGAQVLAADGTLRQRDGASFADAPLIDATAARRASSGDVIRRSRRAGPADVHVRVAAVPVDEPDGHVIVVARSLAGIDDTVQRVIVLLLVAGPVALGLVALGGWWVAGKALRPVGRMAAMADGIHIDDLSRRVPVPAARDELAHLATTLNAMLDRLHDGVETRQRLIADASHELRAPLAAMRAELEVSLRTDELDPNARAALSSARDEVVRMGRIVNDLLTLARVDAGHLALLRTPCDLAEVAARAVRTCAALADEVGAHVTVDGGPLELDADAERLEQVVANLVDNAIRHGPPGVRVEVTIRQVDGTAEVAVADDGAGIPAEERERVFERFRRLDAARGRVGGAGLGLAICAEIVRAHGGEITVAGRAPRGTTFVVRLPGARRPRAVSLASGPQSGPPPRDGS